MEKDRQFIRSSNFILFFSQLFILFKFAFSQQYTFTFNDAAIISQYSLSANQNVTYNYKLTNCPSQDRKILLSTYYLDMHFDKRDNMYSIQQYVMNSTTTSFKSQDQIKVSFKVAEICMKYVYQKRESYNTNNKNLLTTTYKSKPSNFNTNMKAFPFIIGYEVPQETRKNSVFIEKWEVSSDGFIFYFNSSYPSAVTSIDINYLYYDESSLNKYYKLDSYLDKKYKKVSPAYKLDSPSPTITTKIPFSCPYDDDRKCKMIIGWTGFEFVTDSDDCSGCILVRGNLFHDLTAQVVSTRYETWGDSKISGMTSQVLVFEMIKCNTNSNSQKINYKESCVEKCPDGEYQDSDTDRNVFICKNCSSICKTCSSISVCLSCAQNQFFYNSTCSQNQPSITYCLQQNDFYQCFKCSDNCTACNQTECTSCVDNYYLFNKICVQNQPIGTECKKNSNNYYSCVPCPSNCTKCISNECSSCSKDCFLYNKNCFKIQPQFTYCPKENDYLNCIDCPKNCSSCILSDCTSCIQPYALFSKQCISKCPNGYISDKSACVPCTDKQMPTCVSCYKTCFICEPFEVSVIPNSCTACQPTRQLVNGQCKCLDPQDKRETFHECSYENIAVLTVTLSNTIPLLTIDFGKQLNIPANFNVDQNSKSLCLQLFTNETLQLLGLTPQCSISDKQINLLVQKLFLLQNINIKNTDDQADIFDGDLIYLKQNILSFVTTSSILIEKYMNNVVVQDKVVGQTKLSFEYLSIENSCNDISIKFLKITNGAQRGIRQVSWSLQSYVPAQPTLQTVLQNLFQKASLDKKLDLVITKGLIKSEAKVTIKIDYILKANVIGYEEIYLSTKSDKKVMLDAKSPIINPFYKYQSGYVLIELAVKVCDPTGDIVIHEPLDFSITSTQLPSVNYSNSSYEQKDYTIEFQPFTLNVGQIIIHINAKLISDKFKEQNYDFNLDVQSSKLFIKMIGGNNQVNYKKAVIIQSKVRDFDLQTETEPQGINIQWKCKDPVTEYDCVDKNGQQLILPPQVLTTTIEANTFNPYTIIHLSLVGKKDVRESSDSITIIFQEFDLPPLEIQIDTADAHKVTVNMNEEIVVNLQYTTNVNLDLLSYSGTITYLEEVVGIIKFDYPKLRFQIWNYFSGFKKEQSSFQIRFSVFNPFYFMPSMFLNKFVLNFAPHNCKLDVTPTIGGFSLETKFFIQFLDCEDENYPIQYQFFYYKTVEDFEYEKKYPLQVKRRQLNDIQLINYIESQLPQGDILILAQAIDSKNAIYNSTISIKIEQQIYDEQTYISIIQSKLDSINSFTSSIVISYLSITCDDILKRIEFKSSSSLNSKKIEIINLLTSLQQNLPSYSTFSTVSNKAITSLTESGIVFEQSKQEDLINQLIKQLDESSNLQQTNLQVSQEKLKQKIYDSFQVIDSLDISNSEQKQNTNNKVIELTDKINQHLFVNILPNEDPIVFQGKQMNLLGTQITEKYMCSYFLCDNNQRDSSKQTTIYNFKKSEYQNNPYSEDVSFKNYTNSLKQKQPNLQIQNFPVLNPSISNLENTPIESFPKQSILAFQSNTTNPNSKNMSCLTKNKNLGWTKQGCGQIYDENAKQYLCFCKDLSPTTIIDDLEDLLDNENINTAFSSDGISNIANFKEFYKYAVFWVLLSMNFLFLKLFLIAKKLDLIDSTLKLDKIRNFRLNQYFAKQQTQYFKKNKVLPQFFNNILDQKSHQKDQNNCYNSNNNSTESVFLSPRQTQNTQNNNPLKSIFSRNQKYTEDMTVINLAANSKESQEQKKNIIQHKEDSPQIPFQIGSIDLDEEMKYLTRIQSAKQTKTQFILNSPQQGKQIPDDQKENINSQQQSLVIEELTSDRFQKIELHEEIKKDEIKQETISPIETISRIESNQQGDKQGLKILNKIPFYKQIFIFHNFFGIFYVFNPNVSRKLRFLIFYLRSVHSLAISIIFDQDYSIVQNIAIALFNSLSIMIAIKLIEFCFSFRNVIGKILSFITTAALFLGYYYLVLSIASGQAPQKSNQFFLMFLLFYLGDLLIFSVFFALCFRQIARNLLFNQKIEGISRFLFRIIQLQLVLVSID